MYWVLRFCFRMGMVLINAFQVCLELLPNFHGENSTAFRLIFVAEIWQCFATDAIFTKLSTWEYSNGDTQFSRQKSDRISRLARYGTPVGFRVCVYSTYQHTCTVTSQSPSKHQVCWCVSHTWGNQCHLVTWIKTITKRWSCTQSSMNMHLQQSPWMHTHTTRSRALVINEGHLHNHENPSYNVHDTHTHVGAHTHTHAYVGTHTYIYVNIYTSCTTLSHIAEK